MLASPGMAASPAMAAMSAMTAMSGSPAMTALRFRRRPENNYAVSTPVSERLSLGISVKTRIEREK